MLLIPRWAVVLYPVRRIFVLATLAPAFLRMIPLGTGLRAHPCSRFIRLQERLCRSDLGWGSLEVLGFRGKGGATCHTAVVLQLFSGTLPWLWGTPSVINLEVWNSPAAAFSSWATKTFGRSRHVLSPFLMSPVRL